MENTEPSPDKPSPAAAKPPDDTLTQYRTAANDAASKRSSTVDEKSLPTCELQITNIASEYEKLARTNPRDNTSLAIAHEIDDLVKMRDKAEDPAQKRLATTIMFYGQAIDSFANRPSSQLLDKKAFEGIQREASKLDEQKDMITGLQFVKDRFGVIDSDSNGYLTGNEIGKFKANGADRTRLDKIKDLVPKIEEKFNDEHFVENNGISSNDLDMELFPRQEKLAMLNGIESILNGQKPGSPLTTFIMDNWSKIDGDGNGIVSPEDLKRPELIQDLGGTEQTKNVVSFLETNREDLSKLAQPLYATHRGKEPYSFSFQDLTSLKGDKNAPAAHRDVAASLLKDFQLNDRSANGALMGAELLGLDGAKGLEKVHPLLWDNENTRHSIMNRYSDSKEPAAKNGFSARDVLALERYITGSNEPFSYWESRYSAKDYLDSRRAVDRMRHAIHGFDK